MNFLSALFTYVSPAPRPVGAWEILVEWMNRFNNIQQVERGKENNVSLCHHRVFYFAMEANWRATKYHLLCAVCLVAQSLSHGQLFATPWTIAHQASLSMGILQARILEWVAIPFSRGSSEPGNQTQVSCIAGGFFTIWATREFQEYLGMMDITRCENWKGCCFGRHHHLQFFTSSSFSVIIY